MKINISKNLIELNKLLGGGLYVAGGFVRNRLLSLKSQDIDICGKFTTCEIEEKLKNSKFMCKDILPRMGTLKIYCKESLEDFEYTTFRTENYLGGTHTPEKVEFNANIYEDALRRDFKMNAIYYDIQNDELIDPTNGLVDIKNKIISCVKNPYEVFNFDGLRLLRLVRFAAELNFGIEQNTYAAASQNCGKLQDISIERKTDEFLKIILCDKKYPELDCKFAHYYAVKNLIDLNLMQYLIPQLLSGDKVLQRTDFHKHDVLEHGLQTFKFSDEKVRLSALLHDVGKPYIFKRTGKMAGHDEEGVKIAEEILTKQIKVSKKQKQDILIEIKTHMYDVDGKVNEKKIRLFFIKYYEHLENIFLLKEADFLGCGLHAGKSEIIVKWENILQKMREENVPFKIKDLKISGFDLLELNIKDEKIGSTLQQLLKLCAANSIKNDREVLLKEALILNKIKKDGK